MNESRITLLTLEYPPERGGVARYLGGLVHASNGAIEVIDVRSFFRSGWPHWWPLVNLCRRQATVYGLRSTVLLVSHVFPVGTAAWIAKMLGGPSYVVMMHGLDVRLVRGFWKHWLIRRICKNAYAVIVNSESTKHDVGAIVRGITIHVVTPAIEEVKIPTREEARRTLEIQPDESLVVSVSRLVPRKGLDFSLRAMSRLQTDRDIRYVVIGDGPDKERLQRVAAESRTKVTWVTDADDAAKRRWLSAADIFLLPVRDEGSDVEGFGIVFLEAAQAGIPSIAGKSGGAIEAVRNERTGLVVDPDDLGEIKHAIERLLDDPALRRRLGEEGRARANREFRWSERWDTVRRIIT